MKLMLFALVSQSLNRAKMVNNKTKKPPKLFGVTKFKNGDYLAQAIAPKGGNSADEKPVKVIGVFKCGYEANRAYRVETNKIKMTNTTR